MPCAKIVTGMINLLALVTSVLLVLAAALAFLVQKARYRIEIEPDIRVEDVDIEEHRLQPDVNGVIRLPILVTVSNHSRNRAYDLKLSVGTSPAPGQSHRSITIKGLGDDQVFGGSATLELGLGDQCTLRTLISWHIQPADATEAEIIVAFADIPIDGFVTVAYRGSEDIAHFFMTLFHRRFAYKRTRSVSLALYANDGMGGVERVTMKNLKNTGAAWFQAQLIGPSRT